MDDLKGIGYRVNESNNPIITMEIRSNLIKSDKEFVMASPIWSWTT